ncbi:MAG: S8 family serine peptidase [Leptolyngbyaceae cyanobacterium SU_3_3]|nr:S8 family serine peptidase [Leptolyngbyaceae cyanobacterium SU_3_3]
MSGDSYSEDNYSGDNYSGDNYSGTAQVNFTLEGGVSYLLRATSQDAFATGSYELNVELEAPIAAQARQFSPVYGYGLVDAAAAVAQSIGRSTFRDVANLGGRNWGLDMIQAPEVWAKGFTGKDIVVAVVDTGVDYTHIDLDDNIWVNEGEIFGNGIDDDRNGYVDDIIGWNFVDSDYNPMDLDSHGTHVAGIIAAERNRFGVTGVAYNAKIMPVRVLDENGFGSYGDIANGIIYAANNGANVINLSLGGGYSAAIETAIQYATQRGAIVVMAAGNSGEAEPSYPAHLATDYGIAVGAIDRGYDMADFSNQAGQDSAMRYVVAPGVDILSTVPGDGYESLNGTSMAAPYVAGVAALMLSATPI